MTPSIVIVIKLFNSFFNKVVNNKSFLVPRFPHEWGHIQITMLSFVCKFSLLGSPSQSVPTKSKEKRYVPFLG